MTSHVSASPAAGSIKVACIQMHPVFGDVAANVAHSLELIDRAASQGANLVVLPELANTGYMFASREEAFALAEQIPGGPSVEAWTERAARHGRSMSAELREIVREALARPESNPNAEFKALAAKVRALSAGRPQTPSEVLLRESRDER